MKKYILAGGPGVGKTQVAQALAVRGHPVIQEVARIIIAQEQEKTRS